MSDDGKPSLRDHFAAERTLLAWVRTAIALMGLGFLIARFSTQATAVEAEWLGGALVLAGSATNLLAGIDYAREVRRLGTAGVKRRASRLGLGLAFLLSGVGAGMTLYVLVSRQ